MRDVGAVEADCEADAGADGVAATTLGVRGGCFPTSPVVTLAAGPHAASAAHAKYILDRREELKGRRYHRLDVRSAAGAQ